MATNPYTYGSLGQRWTVGEPTSKSLLDLSRIKTDTNRWTLEQLLTNPDNTAAYAINATAGINNITASGNSTVLVDSTGGSAVVQLESDAGQNGLIYYTTASAQKWKINNDASTNTLSFRQAADTSVVVIKQDGSVGIGHSTPAVQLHLSDGGSDPSSVAGSTMAIFQNTSATSDITRVSIVGGNAGYSVLDFGDSDSSSPTSITVNHSDNSMAIGTTDGGTDVLIDTDGRVMIGFSSSQNSAYKLQVNSQIYATSATVATSDRRFKNNIKDITNATALISALKPVQFDWIKNDLLNFDTENTQVGFIAQDVEVALADTDYLGSIVKSNSVIQLESVDVNGTTIPAIDEEYLGIAEGNLIPILTAAIQELTARVDALEAA